MLFILVQIYISTALIGAVTVICHASKCRHCINPSVPLSPNVEPRWEIIGIENFSTTTNKQQHKTTTTTIVDWIHIGDSMV